MKIVSGTWNSVSNIYKMHAPDSRETVKFVGYTLAGMKRAYRKQFGLERKHIEWVIV